MKPCSDRQIKIDANGMGEVPPHSPYSMGLRRAHHNVFPVKDLSQAALYYSALTLCSV